MTGFFNGLENEAVTTGKLAVDTPAAMYDDVIKDAKDGKLFENIGVGVGLGFLGGIAMKQAPLLAVAVAGAFALWEGAKLISGGSSFLTQGWNAGTSNQRDSVASKYATAFSNNATPIVESLPGFFLGGQLGVRAVSPIREMIAFNAEGSSRLAPGTFNSEGTFNVLNASDQLSEDWTGSERFRSIKLSSGKISRPITGTKDTIPFEFPDKPGRLLWHSHPPADSVPTVLDVSSTNDAGLIQSGPKTSFYMGQKGTAMSDIRLRWLEIDPDQMKATRYEASVDPSTTDAGATNSLQYRWQPPSRTPLDYNKTLEALRALDLNNPWEQILNIDRVPLPRRQVLAGIR